MAAYCASYPAFKIVPKSAVNNSVDLPSMAGRHTYYTQAMNVCWSDVSYPDVFEKDFNWCDAHYRIASGKNVSSAGMNNKQEQTSEAMIYPNPSDGAVKLNLGALNASKVYSISIKSIEGKKMSSFSGSPINIKQAAEKNIGSLKTGVYILSVYDKVSTVITQKIVRL